MCTVSKAAMTSHAHNLRVCLFTLVDQRARGRSQEAGCRRSFRSCQLPSSTALLRSHERHGGGPASPEARQWRVLAPCPLREPCFLSFPPASLWIGASLDSFSCLKSLLYLFVNHFFTASSHVTWFWAPSPFNSLRSHG